MMLYQNTHSMVRSPDEDTGFLDISAGVLQGDTLVPSFSSFDLTMC